MHGIHLKAGPEIAGWYPGTGLTSMGNRAGPKLDFLCLGLLSIPKLSRVV